MNELIESMPDGSYRVSSKIVAEKFNKRHADVLRAIEKTKRNLSSEFNQRNFASFNITANLKGAIKAKEYRLSRDGFSLIAMSFTGKEAMQWKVKFLEAFNIMEHEIIPALQQRIAQLESQMPKRKLLAGPKAGIIAAPLYQEDLFGELSIVGYMLRQKEELPEEDVLEAKIRHRSKIQEGLLKGNEKDQEKLSLTLRTKASKARKILK